jgi:hypothetical protein
MQGTNDRRCHGGRCTPAGLPTIRTGDKLSDDLAEIITKYGIG